MYRNEKRESTTKTKQIFKMEVLCIADQRTDQQDLWNGAFSMAIYAIRLVDKMAAVGK